jgi:hypothetical protein
MPGVFGLVEEINLAEQGLAYMYAPTVTPEDYAMAYRSPYTYASTVTPEDYAMAYRSLYPDARLLEPVYVPSSGSNSLASPYPYTRPLEPLDGRYTAGLGTGYPEPGQYADLYNPATGSFLAGY